MQNPKCPFILYTMIISYQVWSWSTPALEEKKWECYCFSFSYPSFNQSDDHGLIFPSSQNLSGGWFVYHFNILSCLRRRRRRRRHPTNLLWRYVMLCFLVALMSFFTFSNLATYFSSWNNCYQVVKSSREKFTQEFSFQSKDKDISLAKVLLHYYCDHNLISGDPFPFLS